LPFGTLLSFVSCLLCSSFLLFHSFSFIFWSLFPPPLFLYNPLVLSTSSPFSCYSLLWLSSQTNRKYRRSISALFHLALEILSPDGYKNNILLVFFNRNQQKRRKCSQLYLRQIVATLTPAPSSNNFINNTKQPDFLTV
jgi:hypothetical protein